MNTERKVFLEIVDLISARPGMFVGTEKLRDVANYLHGLEHGLNGGLEIAPITHVFRRWIEGRFLYCRAAWHWDKLLLHTFRSDAAALAALPNLFREFFSELDTLGEAGIEAKVSEAILAKNRALGNHARR
jgi:hypothetical protein